MNEGGVGDGLARPIAELVYKAPTASAVPTRSTRYVHPDPLGSPDALTDEAGQLLERRSYEPFGAARNPDWRSVESPGPELSNLGFTGHEDDRELGLTNMGGRLYDPKLGRFLQPDAVVQAPGSSLSWNPYSYAFHSPLRYTDPSGWQVEAPQGDSDEHHSLGEGATSEQMLERLEGNDAALAPSGPWANGVEPTGPTPYGAQPQPAPAVLPAQPVWSMRDTFPMSSIVPDEVDDDDGRPLGPLPFVYPAGAVGAAGAAMLTWEVAASDALLGLLARAPGAVQGLNNLAAGAIEGVAPGALGGLTPELVGVGVGTLAAAERGLGRAEAAGGRLLGRLGGWFRSFSRGGGPKLGLTGQAAVDAARRSASRLSPDVKCFGVCQQFASRLQAALKRQNIAGTLVRIERQGARIADMRGSGTLVGDDVHEGIRVGNVVFDNLNPGGVPWDVWRDSLRFIHDPSSRIADNFVTLRPF